VNNTIWDTGSRGIALSDDPGSPTRMVGAVVANNVVSSLRAAPSTMAFEDHNLIGDGTLTGPHDLFVHRPPFVAPASSDYRLAARSPSVDAGLTRVAPSTDIRGAPRKGAADMGAYELGGGGARR